VAPEAIRTRLARVVLPVAAALAALVAPAHAMRLVDYNVTNYPGVLFPQRQQYFRIIFAPLGADIVTCQEFQSQAGVDSFLTNVLNVNEPGQWAAAPFINGNDTDNALFYKPAKVQFLGGWAWTPPEPSPLRLVNAYRLRPVGYSSEGAELRIYSQHLKASNTSTDANRRLLEATGIRDSMNAMPPGTHAILLGDFNIYTTTEAAFQKFFEVQTDNDGQLYDPYHLSGVFNQAAFAPYHTQCPCLTCPTGSGYSGGGLDDRFDMFLPTLNLNTTQGLAFLPNSYKPVGNDGQHYNKNITDAPTIPEGSTYANALWNASDHLPIRVDLQLPARIVLSAPSLAFGSVIVGGAAAQDLQITNPATLPADALDYSLSASAGFTAPGGSFSEDAGGSPAVQSIGMDSSTPGTPSGTLTITSDAPDAPTSLVGLSGTVLAHANASLDSLALVTDASIDFGTHDAGQFTNQLARVHDRGYGPLQARLAVNDATITGGDGRFSIVGGFNPVLVAGTAANFEIAFDDNGAIADTQYDGTLTFTNADEPLPGEADAAPLTVQLHAHMGTGTTGVPGQHLPTVLRFDAPRPNPTSGYARFAFDLPHAAPVTLEIFDLAGRRVARLASGEYGPGHYELSWGGAADGARPGAGLYFVRFATPGLQRTARLALMP